MFTNGEKIDVGAPLTTEAYGATERGGRLELRSITLPPLEATQVQIEMTHCG